MVLTHASHNGGITFGDVPDGADSVCCIKFAVIPPRHNGALFGVVFPDINLLHPRLVFVFVKHRDDVAEYVLQIAH